MAEPARGPDIRRFLLLGGVIAVVAFSALFFLYRGCAQTGVPGPRKPGYTLIYSSLDLRDAANVIARLKELNLPYEIRDEGRAIAVPKEKADQARLGLAEKNLPAGGVVGWEIFDEAKLGATDFDRRIQLIRAISGELSRTIRRISGVEDARVQVVIPETKLFAATVAPVTASVMLRLRPGFMLATEKINGIVHLVASSVENLQPENVTVVDDSGRILTARAAPPAALAPLPPPPAETVAVLATPEAEVVATAEVVLKKEKVATKEAVAAKEVKASPEVAARPVVTKVASLTAAERVLLKVQTKKELEQELSGKAQELLNRFYPINSVIVRVVAEIKPAKDQEIVSQDLKVKKLNAVVLVDNRVEFNANLKQATYTTVAAAIGYNKKRGDSIILQRVPFHLATPPIAMLKKEPAPPPGPRPIKPVPSYYWLGGGVVLGLFVFWLLNMLFRGRGAAEVPTPAPSYARERVSALDQVKMAAEQNPERIAELLKKWLSE